MTSSFHSLRKRLCSRRIARSRLWYEVSAAAGVGPRGAGDGGAGAFVDLRVGVGDDGEAGAFRSARLEFGVGIAR